MQSARSRMTKGTPCSLRQAAVARPDGPDPIMIGPFTHTHLRDDKSKPKFSVIRAMVGAGLRERAKRVGEMVTEEEEEEDGNALLLLLRLMKSGEAGEGGEGLI